MDYANKLDMMDDDCDIDEINIADMDFVREASMRCDYLLATLNPDDPGLPVYEEYINHSRPMPEWENDTPREILELLNREPKQGWVHWFFSFEHNAGLSTDKVEKIISMVPPGTKLYKNKILGLRGRATGLVFNLEDKSLITVQQARQFKYLLFTAGLDTAYSQNSEMCIRDRCKAARPSCCTPAAGAYDRSSKALREMVLSRLQLSLIHI